MVLEEERGRFRLGLWAGFGVVEPAEPAEEGHVPSENARIRFRR